MKILALISVKPGTAMEQIRPELVAELREACARFAAQPVRACLSV